MIRQRHPAATLTTTRLEFFTDGVFAIAATLLVLDLTTRSLGAVNSDDELWAALAGIAVPLFNLVLSFALLCLLWTIHVQQFEHIARVDGVIIWLNHFRLLCIVLVPFATNLTTEYSRFYGGRLAMPIVFFFAVLAGYLQWQWALRRRSEMMPDLSDADARAYGRSSAVAVVVGAAVIALSPWIGSTAFLLFLLDRPLTTLVHGKT